MNAWTENTWVLRAASQGGVTVCQLPENFIDNSLPLVWTGGKSSLYEIKYDIEPFITHDGLPKSPDGFNNCCYWLHRRHVTKLEEKRDRFIAEQQRRFDRPDQLFGRTYSDGKPISIEAIKEKALASIERLRAEPLTRHKSYRYGAPKMYIILWATTAVGSAHANAKIEYELFESQIKRDTQAQLAVQQGHRQYASIRTSICCTGGFSVPQTTEEWRHRMRILATKKEAVAERRAFCISEQFAREITIQIAASRRNSRTRWQQQSTALLWRSLLPSLIPKDRREITN